MSDFANCITSSTGIAACNIRIGIFGKYLSGTRVEADRSCDPTIPTDVQAKIIANWKSAGIICSAERAMSGLRDEFFVQRKSASASPIAEMIGSVEKAE